eukprot:1159567-Pelagomonas_calceolata.AAC.5
MLVPARPCTRTLLALCPCVVPLGIMHVRHVSRQLRWVDVEGGKQVADLQSAGGEGGKRVAVDGKKQGQAERRRRGRQAGHGGKKIDVEASRLMRGKASRLMWREESRFLGSGAQEERRRETAKHGLAWTFKTTLQPSLHLHLSVASRTLAQTWDVQQYDHSWEPQLHAMSARSWLQ